MFALPIDPRVIEAYQKQTDSFQRSRAHWRKMMLQCSNHFSTNCKRTRPNDSFLDAACRVHGTATPWKYFKMFQAYSLADVAKNIRCPTFVAEAENDRRCGRGKDLYNALKCPKEYVLFTASEGAGEHCETGGREVFFQKMFDCLDPIMAR
jgi:hypothetical protein